MEQINREILSKKKEKAKLKRTLGKGKDEISKLLSSDLPIDREEVNTRLGEFDGYRDSLDECLEQLLNLYEQVNDRTNEEKTIDEIETITDISSELHNQVFNYLKKQAHIECRNNSAVHNENNESRVSIERDLCQQMRRVSIPIFYGDKRKYESWNAAFIACIDNAPATPEYKLLQLKQYLGGEALKCIESLGHSAASYDAAKDRLERKFGGQRRQIAVFLEELEQFPRIREENAHQIEKFADLLDITVINLKEADRGEELKDGSLYLRLQRKMPETMLARFHRYLHEKEKTGGVEVLKEWVNKESQFHTTAAETIHGISSERESDRFHRQENKSKKTFHTRENRNSTGNPHVKCLYCGGKHMLVLCSEFQKADVSTRWAFAKEERLCFRCLGVKHVGSDCNYSKVCGINNCTKNHNRLLHMTAIKCSETLNPSAPEYTHMSSNNGLSQTYHNKNASIIALRTIPVIVSSKNKSLRLNALLDDGSTTTYINRDIASELGLEGEKQQVSVSVLNGQRERFETTAVTCMLESVDRKTKVEIDANTTKNVTGSLQTIDWNEHAFKWKHLKDIPFPRVGRKCKVDMLIGLDYYELHSCLEEVKGKPGEPTARLTPLGWTCVGNTSTSDRAQTASTMHTHFVNEGSQLNETLTKFWECEHIFENSSSLSCEEAAIIDEVEKSLTWSEDRYEVSIPWKDTKIKLSDNYAMALNRLKNTEKRLKRDPVVAQVYADTIQQYAEKGYIQEVPASQRSTENAWYLPHFPVIRPEKQTTKVRIVFDASARNKTMCLNDTIHQGPKLQNDLFEVLLRFRKYPVTLVCDIAEMYLQVGINAADRPYHRFLWDSSREPPIQYEFNRLVFGVNASPFLAQFVSQQNAKKYSEQYPLAAETVLKSTYMDDSMDSVKDSKLGIELYRQLSGLWAKAGMYARKWLSNSTTVLEQIPQADRASDIDLSKGELPNVKTLGILWSATDDQFHFSSCTEIRQENITKRLFLQKISTLFDPLGLLSPYIVRAKAIMQEIWLSGTDWDEMVTPEIEIKIKKWFSELNELRTVRVARCLQLENSELMIKNTSLHAFVDASEMAYGCVVYARYTYDDGAVSVRLIASKSHVAPLESISIPRLELMAAVLGVRLVTKICKSLKMEMSQTVFWSDSMNVLHWIRNQSRQFKPFVANRLGEIHRNTSPHQWRKIASAENPADYVSRGMSVKELSLCTKWWEGPSFLKGDESEWPENNIECPKDCVSEKKKSAVTLFQTDYGFQSRNLWHLNPERYSGWTKLMHINAWVHRFIDNCRTENGRRRRGPLKAREIQDSETELIVKCQIEHFKKEYSAAKQHRMVPKDSKILSLNPKIDSDGLLRSDSRLKFASMISHNSRFPIILPKQGWITQLVVKHYHELTNHGGTNLTLSKLSTRYCIIAAREAIRQWERTCAVCKKRKAKPMSQIMAPLPVIRAKIPFQAFAHTAVDYGGPFITIQGRGKRREKRYLCLFTCLATRAVHIEMAYGLDTNSFLNAFFRMTNRRGLPVKMLSDNAANFVGADKELKRLVRALDQNRIVKRTADRGIEWQFNPPLAPHWGGVHESLIKAAKRALYAILKGADVTDEELNSALTGAEALLNSRPLTYQSAHPNDYTPLTPNHFLIGMMGGEFAPQSTEFSAYNPMRRWRRVQELVRHFWRRWLREWLPTLSSRKKWKTTCRDLAVDDVVIVVSPDTPRGCWPLGRVTQVNVGADGHVRSARVIVAGKELIRPITKLCPMEWSDQC